MGNAQTHVRRFVLSRSDQELLKFFRSEKIDDPVGRCPAAYAVAPPIPAFRRLHQILLRDRGAELV
ncbi:MAG: hypothetical protein ACXWJ8_07215, partial [Xanthobacteraceae bacterium]